MRLLAFLRRHHGHEDVRPDRPSDARPDRPPGGPMPQGQRLSGRRCTARLRDREGDRGLRCILPEHDGGRVGTSHQYKAGYGWVANRNNGDFVRYPGEQCRSVYHASSGRDYRCEHDREAGHSHYNVMLGHGWDGGLNDDWWDRW